MMVELEYVRLKAPIDSHDQRSGVVLDKPHGWECALDAELRVMVVRHRETWTAEVPLENVAHYRRAAEVIPSAALPPEEDENGRPFRYDVPAVGAKPKGRKR